MIRLQSRTPQQQSAPVDQAGSATQAVGQTMIQAANTMAGVGQLLQRKRDVAEESAATRYVSHYERERVENLGAIQADLTAGKLQDAQNRLTEFQQRFDPEADGFPGLNGWKGEEDLAVTDKTQAKFSDRIRAGFARDNVGLEADLLAAWNHKERQASVRNVQQMVQANITDHKHEPSLVAFAATLDLTEEILATRAGADHPDILANMAGVMAQSVLADFDAMTLSVPTASMGLPEKTAFLNQTEDLIRAADHIPEDSRLRMLRQVVQRREAMTKASAVVEADNLIPYRDQATNLAKQFAEGGMDEQGRRTAQAIAEGLQPLLGRGSNTDQQFFRSAHEFFSTVAAHGSADSKDIRAQAALPPEKRARPTEDPGFDPTTWTPAFFNKLEQFRKAQQAETPVALADETMNGFTSYTQGALQSTEPLNPVLLAESSEAMESHLSKASPQQRETIESHRRTLEAVSRFYEDGSLPDMRTWPSADRDSFNTFADRVFLRANELAPSDPVSARAVVSFAAHSRLQAFEQAIGQGDLGAAQGLATEMIQDARDAGLGHAKVAGIHLAERPAQALLDGRNPTGVSVTAVLQSLEAVNEPGALTNWAAMSVQDSANQTQATALLAELAYAENITRGSNLSPMVMDRLTEGVRLKASGQDAAPAVVQFLKDRPEGNPLYTLAQMYRSSGMTGVASLIENSAAAVGQAAVANGNDIEQEMQQFADAFGIQFTAEGGDWATTMGRMFTNPIRLVSDYVGPGRVMDPFILNPSSPRPIFTDLGRFNLAIPDAALQEAGIRMTGSQIMEAGSAYFGGGRTVRKETLSQLLRETFAHDILDNTDSPSLLYAAGVRVDSGDRFMGNIEANLAGKLSANMLGHVRSALRRGLIRPSSVPVLHNGAYVVVVEAGYPDFRPVLDQEGNPALYIPLKELLNSAVDREARSNRTEEGVTQWRLSDHFMRNRRGGQWPGDPIF